MSFINEKTKEINAKIIYAGPPRAGKSTSLRRVYDEVKKGAKGEPLSLREENDQTLFFNFVPLTLGTVRDFTVRLHLYTVPGEAAYRQSRSLISTGIDGVLFVADSQLERMEDNLASLRELRELLRTEGEALEETPLVFQYNKRDLSSAVPAKELHRYLNEQGTAEFETIATKGVGVFEAFREISRRVLRRLQEEGSTT